jgi:hypothetical protein
VTGASTQIDHSWNNPFNGLATNRRIPNRCENVLFYSSFTGLQVSRFDLFCSEMIRSERATITIFITVTPDCACVALPRLNLSKSSRPRDFFLLSKSDQNWVFDMRAWKD